jgi:hypothetical protein
MDTFCCDLPDTSDIVTPRWRCFIRLRSCSTGGTQENEHFQKFHEYSMFYTIAELVIGSRGISMTFPEIPEMPEIPTTAIFGGFWPHACQSRLEFPQNFWKFWECRLEFGISGNSGKVVDLEHFLSFS